MPAPPERRGWRDGGVVDRLIGLTHAADVDPGPARPLRLVPPTGPGRYTFAHVNVVIPDLPDPHRYLACMVLVGQTGTRVFDDDRAVRDRPSRTATTTIATAASGDGYRVHRPGPGDLAADGRSWRLGDAFALDGTWPSYRVGLAEGDLRAELDVAPDGPVTWFARSPLYDHVGYPSRATGELRGPGGTVTVDAPCSLEYARARTVHALLDRRVPARLKLPWDFFCYQVLALDERRLLLLTRIGMAGRPVFSSVIRWAAGERPTRWCRDVAFEVLEHEPEAPVSPSGAAGPLARRVRWSWVEPGGPSRMELRSDGSRHPGVGTGWIGGWSFTGTDRGEVVAGRAYGEFADRRLR